MLNFMNVQKVMELEYDQKIDNIMITHITLCHWITQGLIP